MVGSSLRDRFFTAPTARAITSPTGILLGVAVAAVSAVAGLPLGAAVALGVAAWVGKVALSLPRGRRRERIDPFTLKEPWRHYVRDALQARNRFDEAVGRTPSGPLHDHLAEIADRVHAGVEESWLVARRGETLVAARRAIDVTGVDRRLAKIADARASDPALERVASSLEAQRATAA
ncbi:MAG TPA: hypothetical protein VE575_07225, partial [Acidimicrobiales bacterium]|nr:hypothetical protein [Acidimicrobiales bacterium]